MDKQQVIETLAELRETADYLPTDQKYLDALEHAQNFLEEGGVEQIPCANAGFSSGVGPEERAGLISPGPSTFFLNEDFKLVHPPMGSITFTEKTLERLKDRIKADPEQRFKIELGFSYTKEDGDIKIIEVALIPSFSPKGGIVA